MARGYKNEIEIATSHLPEDMYQVTRPLIFFRFTNAVSFSFYQMLAEIDGLNDSAQVFMIENTLL